MKHYEPQFNLFDLNIPRGDPGDGATLRNRGVTKVLDNNKSWMENALAVVSGPYFPLFATNDPFTGEDIRDELTSRPYVGFPSHPNAWGALINTLARRGLIVATGQYVVPKDKSSHARKIQLYRRP